MKEDKKVQLTSSEIAPLWNQYLNDSASVCMLTYYLETAEDDELKELIKFALDLSKIHIDKLSSIFKEEKFAVPRGFSLERDVDVNAPRLFSDTYILNYLHQMAKIGLLMYSGGLSGSARADITEYYIKVINETMELFKRSKGLLLSKGLFVRSASLPKVEEANNVEGQGFIFDVLGDKRPLIASEATNLYANIQRNALGIATHTGFGQVAESQEVKKHIKRGIEIAKKHVKVFAGKLEDDDLPVPATWTAEVTDSTTYTFSDRIIMYFTSALTGLSTTYYGTGIAQSPRLDLGVMYNRLSLEVQKYSEDGANIMIRNNWMEQPPMVADRSELKK
ncbi:DUF3231 family protein [Salinibacillus xinjiangensis]|uniref:DUF3231 family protein n=1 Tax=Salinibacillus xinjiangensis TaxID=1229268 RepID=A0A6G1X4H6_9BACI|nr:DUF3231 family protein [Salinibacillus xinjiangensis]MRG85864.1 DUF3231 family protein [Salinibacillus xinjiangensis]